MGAVSNSLYAAYRLYSSIILFILDVDECLTNPCNINAECSNVPGSFACICRPGYSGNGFDDCSGNIVECLVQMIISPLY